MRSAVAAALLVLQVATLRPEVQRAELQVRHRAPAIPHFDAFVRQFGRTYHASSSEHALRRKHYEERAQEAATHNANPLRLWDAGVSHLWDWTHEEFSRLNGHRPRVRSSAPDSASALFQDSAPQAGLGGWLGSLFFQSTEDRILDKAASQSWELHALRPVDQGECGSCWAIAAATVLEAHAEIAGLNRTFSAQHLVNCVQNPHHCGGSGGCQGATSELALDYASLAGLPTAEEVPYTGGDDACQNELASPVHGLVGWKTLPENKYKPLLLALVDNGPVAVSVGATTWMFYDNGIFDFCGPNALVNHAVALIGFGSDDGTGYWKIRNSWGAGWGEKGHIRLLRLEEEEEYCGMDVRPLDGVGCDGGPAEVRVCGRCGILMDSSIPQFSL